MTFVSRIVIAAFILATASISQAQLPPIMTDEPVQSDSSQPRARSTPKPVELGRTQEEIERDQKREERIADAASNTFGVAYTLSPLGFPVLLKHGPSVWWPAEGRWQLEASYLTGGLSLNQLGVDIGSANEALIALNARRYSSGGYFNWIIGLSHQSYDVTLGRDLLSSISNIQSSVDVVKTQTIGVQLGFGNRWEWSNFVIGADWLILNIPILKTRTEAPALDYLNDPGARARIEDAVAVIQKFPSAVLSKITLGYEF